VGRQSGGARVLDAVTTRRSTGRASLSVVVFAFVVGFALPARIVSRDLLLFTPGVMAAAIGGVLWQSRSHFITPNGVGPEL
jgi:hypothetical protein